MSKVSGCRLTFFLGITEANWRLDRSKVNATCAGSPYLIKTASCIWERIISMAKLGYGLTAMGLIGLGALIFIKSDQAPSQTSPNFKVTTQHTGNNVIVFKIQSLEEKNTTLAKVIVNNNDLCTALDASGQVLKFGDVYEFWLAESRCEPVRVRIMTDRGDSVYDMR
jgi:hypothetical protein